MRRVAFSTADSARLAGVLRRLDVAFARIDGEKTVAEKAENLAAVAVNGVAIASKNSLSVSI